MRRRQAISAAAALAFGVALLVALHWLGVGGEAVVLVFLALMCAATLAALTESRRHPRRRP
jgi:hypothetical protein